MAPRKKSAKKAAGASAPAARRELPIGRTVQEVIAILETRVASGTADKADLAYLAQLRSEEKV